MAVALQVVVQGVQIGLAMQATGGAFAYPLDDAYIHLAMGRTLAENGSLGITPDAFASSSSSPAWLLLFAAGWRVFGECLWLPLLLATLAAFGLLHSLDRIWAGHGVSARARVLALAAVVLLLPLPTLACTGMEHTLHAWLAVCFVDRVLRLGANQTAFGTWAVVALALAMASVRLESAFVVAPACCWLLMQRRWAAVVGVVVAAALPWLVLGGWSWSHGDFFLPNSIVLKGGRVPIPGFNTGDHGLATGFHALRHHGHAGACFLLVVGLAWFARRRLDHGAKVGLWLAAATLVLHAQLARFGWFYRYEAYALVLAVAMGMCAAGALAVASPALVVRRLGIALAIVACVFVPRAYRGLRDVPRAVAHTWLQNAQIGRFLAESGGGRGVAVNDIGAPAYYSRLPITDLVGLADTEVARARLDGRFDVDYVRELTRRRRVSLAVVYEDWFPGQLPAEWPLLARWTVQQPFWGATVGFYGVEPADVAHWRVALAARHERLPTGVLVDASR